MQKNNNMPGVCPEQWITEKLSQQPPQVTAYASLRASMSPFELTFVCFVRIKPVNGFAAKRLPNGIPHEKAFQTKRNCLSG